MVKAVECMHVLIPSNLQHHQWHYICNLLVCIFQQQLLLLCVNPNPQLQLHVQNLLKLISRLQDDNLLTSVCEITAAAVLLGSPSSCDVSVKYSKRFHTCSSSLLCGKTQVLPQWQSLSECLYTYFIDLDFILCLFLGSFRSASKLALLLL